MRKNWKNKGGTNQIYFFSLVWSGLFKFRTDFWVLTDVRKRYFQMTAIIVRYLVWRKDKFVKQCIQDVHELLLSWNSAYFCELVCKSRVFWMTREVFRHYNYLIHWSSLYFSVNHHVFSLFSLQSPCLIVFNKNFVQCSSRLYRGVSGCFASNYEICRLHESNFRALKTKKNYAENDESSWT